MNVNFRARMEGDAKIKGGGRSSGRTRREVRKLRKELRKGMKRLRRELRDVRNDVLREVRYTRRNLRRNLRRELYSDRFARFLRSAIGGDEGIREIAQRLLNEAVQVSTTAGPVSGTLTEVGEDYLLIQETPSTIVVVPFRNIVSLQAL